MFSFTFLSISIATFMLSLSASVLLSLVPRCKPTLNPSLSSKPVHCVFDISSFHFISPISSVLYPSVDINASANPWTLSPSYSNTCTPGFLLLISSISPFGHNIQVLGVNFTLPLVYVSIGAAFIICSFDISVKGISIAYLQSSHPPSPCDKTSPFTAKCTVFLALL